MTTKKVWITPKLMTFGNVNKITKNGIPPKQFGSDDGAMWSGSTIGWNS